MRTVFNHTLFKSIMLFLFALFFFRIGSHIPVPFINKDVFHALFEQQQNGTLKLINIMGGGSLSRMSVFTLGVFPYVTASLIVFGLQLTSSKVKELGNTESGKIQLEQAKRFLTVGIVFVHAATISAVLQSQSLNGHAMTTVSGITFYVTTFLSLLAGTFIVVWLSTVLSFVGLGSGMSLIIMIGILSSLPSNIITISKMVESGSITIMSVVALVSLVIGSLVAVVYAENAVRRIPVVKPDPVSGTRNSFIELKANPVGFMPPIFAAICLSMPVSMLQMLGSNAPEFILNIKSFLSHGSYGYVTFYALLTIAFCFVMLRATVKPDQMAESMKAQGVVVRSIRSGIDTKKYLDRVTTSLTVVAAGYLIILCSIPEFINLYLGVPLYLGGTSILIMASTASEARRNAISMLESSQYGEIEKRIMND
ncbi:preprotein translocase subunit SecY [Photobacterium kishitanii]|uniref:Protein translocase subunit SecY n=1 Tax=Photobacterium kishitanii TaxID=318456 RepID=A0A2T3KMQ8_9GAMM|nr:preprotein translocase subunit SecY [Photobacterium kishitanii]PSV01079.1 hypothetical protein C9J27_03410 [Photobacterium kishitanii]